jgi:hypothetical protein
LACETIVKGVAGKMYQSHFSVQCVPALYLCGKGSGPLIFFNSSTASRSRGMSLIVCSSSSGICGSAFQAGELGILLEKLRVSISLAHRILQDLHAVFRRAGEKDKRISATDKRSVQANNFRSISDLAKVSMSGSWLKRGWLCFRPFGISMMPWKSIRPLSTH